jgi:hypothetical protein
MIKLYDPTPHESQKIHPERTASSNPVAASRKTLLNLYNLQ